MFFPLQDVVTNSNCEYKLTTATVKHNNLKMSLFLYSKCSNCLPSKLVLLSLCNKRCKIVSILLNKMHKQQNNALRAHTSSSLCCNRVYGKCGYNYEKCEQRQRLLIVLFFIVIIESCHKQFDNDRLVFGSK